MCWSNNSAPLLFLLCLLSSYLAPFCYWVYWAVPEFPSPGLPPPGRPKPASSADMYPTPWLAVLKCVLKPPLGYFDPIPNSKVKLLTCVKGVAYFNF